MTDKIFNYFKILKFNKKIIGSYLFIGNEFTLVKDIIKLIICKLNFCNTCWDCNAVVGGFHPDVFVVEPQNLSISIENVRDLQHFLSLKSFRSDYKVVLINQAESLSQDAANALLKTLEEPPDNSFIALCATKLDAILPTILSRCKKIFLPIFEKDIKFDNSLFLSFLNGKRIFFKNRLEFAAFLYSMANLFNKFIISKLTNKKLDGYEKDILYTLDNFSIKNLIDFLDEVLKIYNLYNSINENLALNLLRSKLYEDSNN